MTDSLYRNETYDRPTMDLAVWPCCSLGKVRFDVPRPPHGVLKSDLRVFLRRYPEVEAAYLLQMDAGNVHFLTVLLITRLEVDSVTRRWEAERSHNSRLQFLRFGDDSFSRFARACVAPFYVREDPGLPTGYPTAELIAHISRLPEKPLLTATSIFLETLKEDPNDFPNDDAETSTREQDLEKEELLENLRTNSTHGVARNTLLECLQEERPFSLLLRIFAREVSSGRSTLSEGSARIWHTENPLERHVAQVTPLPLIGLANPLVPFPTSECLLLEVDEDWPRFVVSLVARANKIFLISDRLSPGVSTELLAIQHLEREDDTFIIVPTENPIKQLASLHMIESNDVEADAIPVMLRRFATFGITCTATEFMALPQYAKPPE